jgi:hypothetical protein
MDVMHKSSCENVKINFLNELNYLMLNIHTKWKYYEAFLDKIYTLYSIYNHHVQLTCEVW